MRTILIAIYLIIFQTVGLMAQDTLHSKNRFFINTSFNIHGRIESGNTLGNDTRLAYLTKLRVGKFISKKLLIGVGLFYFDYYFKIPQPNFNFNNVFNGDVFLRYYLFRKMYVGFNTSYGGFCESPIIEYIDKNNFIGGVSLGFETKIKGNFYIDLELSKPFDWCSPNCFPKEIGYGYLGVNYYFTKKAK
jgi:hypothetical protein